MKLLFKMIVITSVCLLSLKSYAWNALGHLVVANIAYEQLKPEVQKKVDKMAHDLGMEYSDITDFDHLSPWPDTLRSQRVEVHTHWHYIDLPFSDDGTPLKDITDTDNAVWAIDKLIPVVSNAKANPYERARSLAFLIHIVADIHQPLHTVSRISAAHPEGDKGGNQFLIKAPSIKNQMTLHRFWDQGIDIFTINATSENVASIADFIVSHYPREYFGSKVNDLNPNDWAEEGLNLSSFVYSTPENQVPSAAYMEAGKQSVEKQIALSSYRLANLLNKILE